LRCAFTFEQDSFLTAITPTYFNHFVSLFSPRGTPELLRFGLAGLNEIEHWRRGDERGEHHCK
jgi:hypothetical protein